MKKPKTIKQQLRAQFYKGNMLLFCAVTAVMFPIGIINPGFSWLIQAIMDEMTGAPGALGL